MSASNLKRALAPALALVIVGTGTWTGHQALAEKEGVDKPAAKGKPAAKKGGEVVKPGKGDVAGTVAAVSADGKTITVKLPRIKGEEEKSAPVKLVATTAIAYQNVRAGGAKPTVGYAVAAWWAAGSNDTAKRIVFSGTEGAKAKPSLAGTVEEVAADGKSFALLVPSTIKNEPGTTETIKLTAKTAISYVAVGKGKAKLVAGLRAGVWLAKDSKDVAARVTFNGQTGKPVKGAKAPDKVGKVLAVGADGKGLIVLVPSKIKNQPGSKVELKVAEGADLLFSMVGPGEARPAVGQQVAAWLSTGSTDTMTTLHFSGAKPEPAPALAGTVVAVAADGKALTLQLKGPKRGGEGKQVEIKLGRATQVVFSGVGPDGARLSKGLVAQVWLAEGAKDTAARVVAGGSAK